MNQTDVIHVLSDIFALLRGVNLNVWPVLMLRKEVQVVHNVLQELILLLTVQAHVLIAERENILQEEPVYVLIVLTENGRIVKQQVLVREHVKQDTNV